MNKKMIVLSICMFSTLSSVSVASRLIVKYRDITPRGNNLTAFDSTEKSPLSAQQRQQISNIANDQITELSTQADGTHVLLLERDLPKQQLDRLINKLNSQSNVEYVEEDRLMHIQVVPLVDTRQWNMKYMSNSLNGVGNWFGNNFVNAWNKLDARSIHAGQGVTIAVIDSGYTPHPSFLPRLLSYSNGNRGATFISDCRISGMCSVSTPQNRSAILPHEDAIDLGDFINSQDADKLRFDDCSPRATSSWHGTHVTGILAAQDSISIGGVSISGGAYASNILPIRALGKCGGYSSDINAAMVWATKGNSSIINPTPVKVINMSLGNEGECGRSTQEAINLSNPAVIVVAAGNEKKDMGNISPASCANVISVAASGPNGTLASYSNYGASTITAAGGDGGAVGAIYSTIWNSATSYNQSSGGGFGPMQGTSMATPHVSAAVALLISLIESQPSPYNTWNRTRISQLLQNTADYSNFGVNNCITGTNKCTASGNLNVESAVDYILGGQYAKILEPNQTTILFTPTKLSATVNIRNNNLSTINIESSILLVGLGFSIKQNNCSGNNLPVNSECSITIAALNSKSNSAGYLRLFDQSNQVLLTINLYKGGAVNLIPQSYVRVYGDGGGCSILSANTDEGDDTSLLLVVLLIICYQIKTIRRGKI